MCPTCVTAELSISNQWQWLADKQLLTVLQGKSGTTKMP